VRDGHQKEQEMKRFRHEKRNGPKDECVSRSFGEQLVHTLRQQKPGSCSETAAAHLRRKLRGIQDAAE